MKGTPAIYLGRIIDKKKFRAFVYAPDGAKRLVESWEEFEANMQSGVWFATPDDARASVDAPKTKSKARASRAKKEFPVMTFELKEEFLEDEEEAAPIDKLAFEVTDDFLPKR